MDDRWAIFIDIEGFSALYPTGSDALWGLRCLMSAIHGLGKYVYPESPKRLFAHHLGDGFLIVSDFHEESLDRAVSISIILMKYVSSLGVLARASIAEGGLSDITGCYSDEVMNDHIEKNHLASKMGEGLLTIFPVMGTALINAVGIDKRAPKGPLLVMPASFKSRISNKFISHNLPLGEMITIDWVHTDSRELLAISAKAKFRYSSIEGIEGLVSKYIDNNKIPNEWKLSCRSYLGIVNA